MLGFSRKYARKLSSFTFPGESIFLVSVIPPSTIVHKYMCVSLSKVIFILSRNGRKKTINVILIAESRTPRSHYFRLFCTNIFTKFKHKFRGIRIRMGVKISVDLVLSKSLKLAIRLFIRICVLSLSRSGSDADPGSVSA